MIEDQTRWNTFYKEQEKAVRWEGVKALILVGLPVSVLAIAAAVAAVKLFG